MKSGGSHAAAGARSGAVPREGMRLSVDEVGAGLGDPAHAPGRRAHQRTLSGYQRDARHGGRHIPGAASHFFQQNLPTTRRSSRPEELRTLWAPVLNDHDPKDVVVYCGSGVTACQQPAGPRARRLYRGAEFFRLVERVERQTRPPRRHRPHPVGSNPGRPVSVQSPYDASHPLHPRHPGGPRRRSRRAELSLGTGQRSIDVGRRSSAPSNAPQRVDRQWIHIERSWARPWGVPIARRTAGPTASGHACGRGSNGRQAPAISLPRPEQTPTLAPPPATGHDDDRQHCEVRDQTMPAGPLNVDAGPNGSVTVEAWDATRFACAPSSAPTPAPTSARRRCVWRRDSSRRRPGRRDWTRHVASGVVVGELPHQRAAHDRP